MDIYKIEHHIKKRTYGVIIGTPASTQAHRSQQTEVWGIAIHLPDYRDKQTEIKLYCCTKTQSHQQQHMHNSGDTQSAARGRGEDAEVYRQQVVQQDKSKQQSKQAQREYEHACMTTLIFNHQ